MANAVLTGDFTPDMARDYGCAGRGYFNAFKRAAGPHIDETDLQFDNWKKCVKCASGNSSNNAQRLYEYDPDTDTCVKFYWFVKDSYILFLLFYPYLSFT